LLKKEGTTTKNGPVGGKKKKSSRKGRMNWKKTRLWVEGLKKSKTGEQKIHASKKKLRGGKEP